MTDPSPLVPATDRDKRDLLHRCVAGYILMPSATSACALVDAAKGLPEHPAPHALSPLLGTMPLTLFGITGDQRAAILRAVPGANLWHGGQPETDEDVARAYSLLIGRQGMALLAGSGNRWNHSGIAAACIAASTPYAYIPDRGSDASDVGQALDELARAALGTDPSRTYPALRQAGAAGAVLRIYTDGLHPVLDVALRVLLMRCLPRMRVEIASPTVIEAQGCVPRHAPCDFAIVDLSGYEEGTPVYDAARAMMKAANGDGGIGRCSHTGAGTLFTDIRLILASFNLDAQKTP